MKIKKVIFHFYEYKGFNAFKANQLSNILLLLER